MQEETVCNNGLSRKILDLILIFWYSTIILENLYMLYSFIFSHIELFQ